MNSNLANPFKGLQAYSRNDSERLFGRDRDLILMKDRIFSARTTLLFAGSGVGKTSFLNAKIIPELESQYCTFYHNRWAGPSRPLDAVKSTLAERVKAAEKDGPLLDSLQQFGNGSALNPTRSLDDSDGMTPPAQCLLIFDQFEELFQYHAYEDYFKRFLNELCDVIRREEYRVHVVFSMREEYLGELSVFDNLIPDLFNNYYRLKYPDTREAGQIIEGTCHISGTKVHRENLKQLIRDLSQIEKGVASAAERSIYGSKAVNHIIERSFIIPPYLQIVCHRQWQEEAARAANEGSESLIFLEGYQAGQAQKMLQGFCQEKLSALTLMEQNLAEQSFDFLVTKQGAKMAYEFTSLVDHMRLRFFKSTLKDALNKLSAAETRILRKSHGPDGSIWFELYHDIYGKILDTWRESFRQRKRRASIGVAIAISALLTILIMVTRHWVVNPYSFREILSKSHLEQPKDYLEAYDTYKSLSETWGYRDVANSLLAEAWDRRARYAESRNKRDEAIISWLEALKLEPDGDAAARRRLKAGSLMGSNYQLLRASLHHENTITTGFFSADSRIVVTQSTDQKIQVWDGRTGEAVGTYSNIQSAQPAATEHPGEGSMTTPTSLPTRRESSESRAAADKTPSAKGTTKTNNRLAQKQYYARAAAIHPKLGWLVATISTDDGQPLPFSRNREFAEIDDPPSYQNLSAAILSRDGELSRIPILTKKQASKNLIESAIKIALSPDGQYLAVQVPDHPFTVWKLADKTFVRADGFTSPGAITDITFSPDGRSLLIAYKNKICVWDLSTGKLRYQPIIERELIRSIFSPDGSTFISASSLAGKFQIQVWNTATGKADRTPISFEANERKLLNLVLNSEGKVFISLSSQRYEQLPGIVYLADIQSGKLQETLAYIPGDSARRSSLHSPSGELTLIYEDKEARLFELKGNAPPSRTLKTNYLINKTVLSEDGKLIVTVGQQPRQDKNPPASRMESGTQIVQVWDAATSSPLGNPISNVLVLDETGEYAARQEQHKGPIRILNVRTGEEVASITYSDELSYLNSPMMQRLKLVTSPKGKFFAIFEGIGENIHILERGKTSEPLFHFTVPTFNITTVAFSQDERFFAFGGDETEGVEIRDLSTKQQLVLSNNLSAIVTLSFNKQGYLIAGAAGKGRIWDAVSGKTRYNDLEFSSVPQAIALSADGTMTLVGEGSGTLSLWRFSNNGIGELVGTTVKYDGSVTKVNFSRDWKTGIINAGAWLHIINVDDNTYRASYFISSQQFQCQSTDESSSQFRCVRDLQNNLLEVMELQSGEITGVTAIQGEAQKLSETWKRQLGLRIDDFGNIVPIGVTNAISLPKAKGE